MPFEPNYRIPPRTATHLMRIEAARQAVEDLPITSAVLAGLRETARLFSTHYSWLGRHPQPRRRGPTRRLPADGPKHPLVVGERRVRARGRPGKEVAELPAIPEY